jgi:hypothetical protein
MNYMFKLLLKWLKVGSLSPQHGACQAMDKGNSLQLWGVAVNALNKQPRTADKWWSSSCGGVGCGANTLTTKWQACYQTFQSAFDLNCSLAKWYKWRIMNMKFGTWKWGCLMYLGEVCGRGSDWLVGVWIGISGEQLLMQQYIFGFH